MEFTASLYNLSPKIRVAIENIESLRKRLLCTKLSHANENKLRFNAKVSKLHWSLSMEGVNLTRSEIAKILTRADWLFMLDLPSELSHDEVRVVRYSQALDYVNYNWYMSEREIDYSALEQVFSICEKPKKSDYPNKKDEQTVRNILEYLQSGMENPIIQAGLVQIQIINHSPFSEHSSYLARLFMYLVLYKHGLDFRGMLCLDEYFRRDMVSYENELKIARERGNLTHWLEYFTEGVTVQLEKALDLTRMPAAKLGISASFWRLNSRQKAVLALLENPSESITNRDVQKWFKVSQITASRDLSSLSKMGLLLPRGRGRSVRYVRVR